MWIHTWIPFLHLSVLLPVISLLFPVSGPRLCLLPPLCSPAASQAFIAKCFPLPPLSISFPGICWPLSLQMSDLASSSFPCLLLGISLCEPISIPLSLTAPHPTLLFLTASVQINEKGKTPGAWQRKVTLQSQERGRGCVEQKFPTTDSQCCHLQL